MHDNPQDIRFIDLGVAWTWKYDRPFIDTITSVLRERGLSALEITKENIATVTREILSGAVQFRAFFDRASDEDDSFHQLANHLLENHHGSKGSPARFINPIDKARRATDKATMHLEFMSHGIHVPHTVILAPHSETPRVSISDQELKELGQPFVIKPANTTGGGIGVTLNARTKDDIASQRRHHVDDKYLLQRRVVPVYLSESRAWFRVFYAFGDTRLCWWDDETHIYEEVRQDEEQWFGLHVLRTAVRTISEVCGLDFFSTEFAQTADGTFISVDYVNELCDMRPKSTTPTGVPDSLLKWVAVEMARSVFGK